jgi:hypothetical protein
VQRKRRILKKRGIFLSLTAATQVSSANKFLNFFTCRRILGEYQLKKVPVLEKRKNGRYRQFKQYHQVCTAIVPVCERLIRR